MNEILKYIKELRSKRGDALFYYQNGGCYEFYLLLKEKYPQAEAWHDGDHVLTRIEGVFWDVRGLVLYPLDSEPAILETYKKAPKGLIKLSV